MAGDVYETHRFEAAARKLFERGRIGRDVGGAEFEFRDLDMCQVGVAGVEEPGDAVFLLDLRGADLPRHAETALDGLCGADRPFVILVERKRGVDRRTQVERAGQLPGAADLLQDLLLVELDAVDDGVVTHGVDPHVADVGRFVEREGDRPRRDVVFRDREALAFDARDAEFDDRIGDVVVDARREERRGCKECCFQVSGHNLFLFLVPQVYRHAEVDGGDVEPETHVRSLARSDLVAGVVLLRDGGVLDAAQPE